MSNSCSCNCHKEHDRKGDNRSSQDTAHPVGIGHAPHTLHKTGGKEKIKGSLSQYGRRCIDKIEGSSEDNGKKQCEDEKDYAGILNINYP
ncbi:MAG: hypothetical protein HZB62_16160 [Nitrospirae bacterium]|nr:hypothetical protein [Nitrospirota bacterium]